MCCVNFCRELKSGWKLTQISLFGTMEIKDFYPIAVTCIGILMISCSSPLKENPRNQEEAFVGSHKSVMFKINPEHQSALMNCSQYTVDSVCTLHIPEALVGFATTKVVVNNDKIYLMDSQVYKTILVFNSKGEFQYKIGERGRARDEYIGGPTDFFVDKRNDVHVLDKDGQKILVFHNGKLTRMVDTRSYFIHSFGITSHGRYLFCMNNRSYDKEDYPCLMMCDFGYTNIKKLLPSKTKPYLCNPGNQTFFANGNRLSHIPLLSDSVFVFSNDTLEKVVMFDFNGRFLIKEDPDFAIETRSNDASAIADKMAKYQGVRSLHSYQETDSLILLQYVYQRYIFNWLYNKRTKTINSDGLFEGVVPFTYYFLRGSQVIAYVNEENAKMLRDIYQTNKDRKDELEKSSRQIRDLLEGRIDAPALFYITIK